MKFNFKKIASVLAATIMLGSTVSFAAAAWPAPFVSSGSSAAAVVYGANAPSTGGDMAAAINLGKELDKSITSTTVSGSTGTGVSKELSKNNVKINLGDALDSVYTTLDKDELSIVLANGIYEDEAGTEYDYEQKITLGTTKLTHFVNDEVNADEKPVIGFDVASSTNVLDYTLDFTDNPANSSTNLETTFLEMLGVKYYISDVVSGSNGLELTLLDSANTATVDSSAPKTVTVGDTPYQVEIVSVSENTVTPSSSKATLIVNGVKIDSTNQGNSRKIAENTYLSIIDVNEASRESDLHYVEFSIGSGKLVIANGTTIELNDKTIQEVTSTITTVSGKLSQIALDWTVEDESYLVPGMDLILPGLESIKLSMSEFVSPAKEEMSIANSGDDYMQLKAVKVKDGTISLPVLYSNATLTGFAGLGKDATHRLVTSAGLVLNLNDSIDTYFVASRATNDDFESYVFELVSVNELDSGAHNETTIKNVATGDEIVLTDADDKDFGDINLATSSANGDLGTVTVTLSGTNVHADRIYTVAGMGIKLPVSNSTATGDNRLNMTVNPTQYVMNITEGDKDNNVDASSFTATLGFTTSNGPHVSDISPADKAVESGSDNYEAYAISSRATKMLWTTGGDQDTLDIMYPTSESYAKVYVAETSAAVGAVKDSVKVVTDAEVDSVKSKNLIVVGGSCINTVAASMLGSTSPVCGDSWASQTGAGPGKYLIQVAASPVNAEKIAMLIAGYDSAQTTDAVAKVIEGGISTEVGKTVGPIAA